MYVCVSQRQQQSIKAFGNRLISEHKILQWFLGLTRFSGLRHIKAIKGQGVLLVSKSLGWAEGAQPWAQADHLVMSNHLYKRVFNEYLTIFSRH